MQNLAAFYPTKPISALNHLISLGKDGVSAVLHELAADLKNEKYWFGGHSLTKDEIKIQWMIHRTTCALDMICNEFKPQKRTFSGDPVFFQKTESQNSEDSDYGDDTEPTYFDQLFIAAGHEQAALRVWRMFPQYRVMADEEWQMMVSHARRNFWFEFLSEIGSTRRIEMPKECLLELMQEYDTEIKQRKIMRTALAKAVHDENRVE